ncbi:MAG: DUF1097 domain-containing protein [Actinomycetaceae bacterium]|nr:DUF1097 domain-containing protein [Actinomycetaceae bacterium]
MMDRNLLISASFIGILCGVWAGAAPLIGLSIWAGFAGCTAFFASGIHKFEGFFITSLTGIVGVGTALAMIWLSGVIGLGTLGVGLAVGLIVVFIVMMGAVPWLRFVPGIFVGCYSTFAIDGDWKLLIMSYVVGVALGMICDWGAEVLVKRFGVS